MRAASRPPSIAPAGSPSSTPVMIVPRCRAGPYSAASASSTGVQPPMPSPAMKRSTRICAVLPANAVASDATLNSATPPSSAGRRPTRSPTSPSVIAPMVMPSVPAMRMGARSPGASLNAATIAGPV